MKIIEALKELKLTEKKLARNKESITQYASQPSNEKPYFADENEQRKKVKELIQSSENLVEQYTKLKSQIEYTNLMTTVPIGGKDYTISELLITMRKLGKELEETYRALNDTNASGRINFMNRGSKDSEPVTVRRMYSEEEKMQKLNDLIDFVGRIDSTLEVINASRDLLEIKK